MPNSHNTEYDEGISRREPIHYITSPINHFLHVEAASWIVLLVCAVVALVLANSPFSDSFLAIWKISIGFNINGFEVEHSLKHWINDGLMAIFFFVIGLEVKREIVLGELRDFRRAALPVAAAFGGMLIPAAYYLALQFGKAGESGWGIPMATDIAFVVGCMAVLGSRTPNALRIILLSIAIVDDIGAILVIAFGYTESLHISWLIAGFIGIGLVLVMQRLGIRSIPLYTFVGAGIWLGFHESGVHATIAGVILGLMTPARAYLPSAGTLAFFQRTSELLHGGTWDSVKHRAEKVRQVEHITRETISPLEYLIHVLHPWVSFVIMPIFALANAGVPFQLGELLSPIAVAVMIGLLVGKPMGILLTSWVATKTRLAQLPEGVTWRHLIGGGFLAGIGFTMALFIAGLAFIDQELLRAAKVGVLSASFLAACIGMAILYTAPVSNKADA